MATLKSLVIDLELRRAGFSGQLDNSVRELDALERAAIDSGEVVFGFQDDVSNAAKTASGAAPDFGMLSRGVLELGRGAEDAAMVWEHGGLNGVIRATSNNVTQLLSIIHPLAGGLGGIALAGIAVASSMLSTKDSVAEANDELEKHLDLLERAGLLERKRVELSQQVRDLDSTAAANDLLQQQEDQLAASAAELDVYRDSIESALDEIAAHQNEVAAGEAWGQFNPWEISVRFSREEFEEAMQLRGAVPEHEAAIADLQERVARETELLDAVLEEQAEIVEQRFATQERFDELTQLEGRAAQNLALGEQLSEIGGFFNSLPGAIAPAIEQIEAGEQSLRALQEQQRTAIAQREAEELTRLQEIANAPAELTANLQRGSAEAFRTVLQQQVDAPNRRLESIATQQLRELQQMNRHTSTRTRVEEEIDL